MRYRTVLAPIGAPEIGSSILPAALQLARAFDAHVDVLHVRPDPRGLVPYTGEGMDGSMIEEIMDVTEREGGEREVRSREMFDAFAAEHGIRVADEPAAGEGVSMSWKSTVGREDEVVATRGRIYDIIAVGRPLKDAALPSPITLEAALLDTGRPILVAPPEPGEGLGRSIAIAWEGSPEAARAIADAIPLLEKAESVTILSAKAAQVSPIDAEDLRHRLAWHGIEGTIQGFESPPSELGAAFLDQASRAGADLLIKGAYSQSRLRQLILGGRTRHILAHATIPVLLSH
ncbi:MAG: universal stress protein [Defluviicoccus sp.]|nr:universal stress protein [Defluviicoccus sp.]MDE0382741.1 universal stress protein [Defluviicoccus sp.]